MPGASTILLDLFTFKLESLATDYDGTIADDGVVVEATFATLRELKQSGRKLLLVTGCWLPDLKKVFAEYSRESGDASSHGRCA
jgi:hydroxymethylpyrimidine pyrophosphatase-like HAD family hydrolase